MKIWKTFSCYIGRLEPILNDLENNGYSIFQLLNHDFKDGTLITIVYYKEKI